MGAIELRGVDKVYPGGKHAVRALDLEVADGELLVLLGPSGCGKSTILRLIAGLETLTAGEIHVGGRRVDGEPPQRRDVAMVFQNYALYGHMSVLQNIEFPLRMRGVARSERRERAMEIARMLEMEALVDARPAALSGGQQQRVAMGRALVREPEAFLLDEPLSNLDARLRTQLRGHIGRLQARLGVTTVYVTHDQVEAMSLGDQVAVLRDGAIQQIGPGQHLWEHPANTFVAGFVGQPGMNLIEGTLTGADAALRVCIDDAWVPVPATLAAHAPALAAHVGGRVVMGVRPDALRPTDAADGDGSLSGQVDAVEALGSERILYVRRDDGSDPLAVRLRDAGSAPRLRERVTLAVDPSGIRLFDAAGVALDERARAAM